MNKSGLKINKIQRKASSNDLYTNTVIPRSYEAFYILSYIEESSRATDSLKNQRQRWKMYIWVRDVVISHALRSSRGHTVFHVKRLPVRVVIQMKCNLIYNNLRLIND